MEKEKSSEIVLSYEDFVNVKKMLYSANLSDSDMALDILQNAEPKKVLPYVLFIIMETSWIRKTRGILQKEKDDPCISAMFRLYKKVNVCKGLKNVIDLKTPFYSDPFICFKPGDIEKVIKKSVTTNMTDTLIDHISRFVNIGHIVDSIIIQDNPEDYYGLENEINDYIFNDVVNCISNSHKYKYYDLPWFHMHFNLQDAIKEQLKIYDKTRKSI